MRKAQVWELLPGGHAEHTLGNGRAVTVRSQSAAWPWTRVAFMFYRIFFSASCTEFPWFLVSALRYARGDGARGEVTKKLTLPGAPVCLTPV